MNNFVELNLGKAGLEFVQNSLNDWKGLAKDAASLPIQTGTAMALVPKGTSMERALQFSKCNIKVSHYEPNWFEDRFHRLMKEHQKCSFIVQDMASISTDDWVKKSDSPMFFHNKSIYYYLNRKDFRADKIVDLLYAYPGSHHVFGFFLKCGITDAIQKQDVPSETYKGILDNIVEIYVSAYDREGHVIWTR